MNLLLQQFVDKTPMKFLLKLLVLGHFLTCTALVNSNLAVKPADDNNTSEPKCKSIENAITEVKDELVEIKEEIREIKEKGL